MRVVHLNPFYFPYAGGSERRIRELARRHARRHEVHVVTSRLPGTPAHEVVEGVRIHRLPSRFWLRNWWNPPLVTTPRLRAALRDLAPDVLELHYRWAPAYHRAFLAAAPRSKLVFTYHNSFGEGVGLLGWASHANDAWTRRFIRRADAIVCVSDFVRADLERRGFPRDRLVVAPNAVDAERLNRLADEGTLPTVVDGTRFIVGCGRLVDLKGYDVALQVLARLPTDVHFVLAGEGPLRSKLEAQAARLGVAERFHALGWVPEEQKMRLESEAVLFLHPTRSEAFGLAPLEAMAVGTPVVATDVGGLPEVVGLGGRLTRPDDPAAMADVAHAILQDASLRTQLGERARRHAATFDWDRTAAIHEALYERLMEGKTT